jgi:hypothetical protein
MFESRSRSKQLFSLFAGAIALAVAVVGVASGATSGTFSATFTGSPPAPMPAAPSLQDFDVQVHQRSSRGGSLPPMQAQHGPDCGAPPATHSVSTVADAVFICKDHLMTALNGDEYGMIYLTPNRLLDVSSEATVRWDVSTADQSQRDWLDVWVTPYADNLALPLQPDLPDANGEPRNGIHIEQDFSANSWKLVVFRNGVRTEYGNGMNANATGAFVPDFARRETMELRLTPNRVTLTMPTYGLTLIDQAVALPFTSGVVQFGHHSYDPTKDGSGSPNTWHWDNFSLTPSTPFTILKTGGPSEINRHRDFPFSAGRLRAALRRTRAGCTSKRSAGSAARAIGSSRARQQLRGRYSDRIHQCNVPDRRQCLVQRFLLRPRHPRLEPGRCPGSAADQHFRRNGQPDSDPDTRRSRDSDQYSRDADRAPHDAADRRIAEPR